MVLRLTYPSSLLSNPLGNAVAKHKFCNVAGDSPQEASHPVLVDMDCHPIAKAQQRYHTAPVDAAVKQTVEETSC